ncbi:class I SAM-dependent methyltransferase [Pseudomonas sp.]|uniref:class I SAM-dependent DNA methyltransferase n=1 Tax=Pseudomonas sp. TaxID=306 RepID=UPI0028AF5FB6|nr:class I SAM-dependent methyltransferase [Pseudomonas sp.]
MPGNALYTDLSGYYDLMCADIDYQAQSQCVQRLQQLFGNRGRRHLDLACGTGPHVRHFIDAGFSSGGLDINQPMLDRAALRCPEAQFTLLDMCGFTLERPVDLVTCFLYSIHYSGAIERLKACIASVHGALAAGGLFCFNAVDKRTIANGSWVSHSARHADGLFRFRSGWHYAGSGERQSLQLHIERTSDSGHQVWHDEHPMVAVCFDELAALLQPGFEVHILEHDYDRLVPWDGVSGNALFACVKR